MEIETSNKTKDKLLHFLEYLTALARVNTKIIRELDEYQKVLWIHEIPREPKYCFARSWGETEEHFDDIWIEVKKFPEPQLPRIPDACKDWVKYETIKNINDIPELNETIAVQKVETDPETGEKVIVSQRLALTDFPQVQKDWESYVDKFWFPWTEVYGRYAAVQNIYSNLFLIHQEQTKLGEQYELVFCFGLLTWRTPTGHQVRRHLVTAKASLEFEPHIGKFTIKAPLEGDQTEVEFDMLDLEVRPPNAKQLSDEGHRALQDNLWDRPAIDSLLNAIANSLADRGQGQYSAQNFEPLSKSGSDKPLVEYAPALILRKRSLRGLERALTKIKEQIEGGSQAPDAFLDVCECLDSGDGCHENDSTTFKPSSEVQEIYFPLPANEEQRRIILTLNRQDGVLVQGPPGTGKSHTIANLICHLLATGQRVLVTAKTPRALQVLHDKLPEDIKPLCINLLGNGTEERESLEKSVAGILLNIDKRNEIEAIHRSQQLEAGIRSNREDRAAAEANIIALRESETYEHTLSDGVYGGTAAKIAQKLNEEADTFSWFQDRVAPNSILPLSPVEVDSLCHHMVDLDSETERQLDLYIPDPDADMPPLSTAGYLFERERIAEKKALVGVEHLHTTIGRVLRNVEGEAIEKLHEMVSEIANITETLRGRSIRWVQQATDDVLTDNDTRWKELSQLSTNALEGLRDAALKVDAYDISIPDDLNRKELLHDAAAIKTHFDSGGKSGFWVFGPKVIRKHGSFIRTCKVDGADCSNLLPLQKLIDYLTVEQRLERLWSLWDTLTATHSGRFPLQTAEIEDLNEGLARVIELCLLKERAAEHVCVMKGLSITKWEDTAYLRVLAETCAAALAEKEMLSVSKQLDEMQRQISRYAIRNDVHSIVGELTQAFTSRDIENYGQLLDLARQLKLKAQSLTEKREAIQKLAVSAPKLAQNLSECNDPNKWSEQLRSIESAWAWARAKSWLEEFLNSDGDSLQRHVSRLSDDIRKDLAELAALKAWDFCFSRMHEEQRRHLENWKQAMKKLGKGTGKHAHTHRQNAQRHLNECRDSVPAWIMPLHRMYETVEPGAGIFDVIIVDEASQCGPEALPLMYLGKRILVVGDDKQISPEAVGIERGQVQRLMHDHLFDFIHFDSFDVESSLFDHGRIRFRNRITLREHFRCMPEIINFSNDLCYRADPLIPLRQYPPDRLEPLKVVHVTTGYREGSGQRVINRPEAEALANMVESCCKDERYQGMTMGVIVLQGEAQAYLIEGLLLGRLGAEEMKKRRLICGNPYSFQGDERDVIFLSMVAAPTERIGPLVKEADQRRFNVAASRAQDQMWLFHSATLNDLSKQCFRYRLLSYFNNPKSRVAQALGEEAEALQEKALRANRMIEKPPAPFESWFEVDVALRIAGRGYRVVPQYEFADKRIDLVVQGSKNQLAVECDGDAWHGAEEYTADMERQRKLERCNWHFFRVRESAYRASPDKTLEPLWSILKGMGIFPITLEETEDAEQENGFEAATEPEEWAAENEFEDEDVQEDGQIQVDDLFPLPTDGQSPNTIHEALRAKSDIIGRLILEILQERPNFSCVRDRISTYILKRWNIRTRGEPWQKFAAKVDDIIAVMARKGYISIYKSKNVRIKLGWESYPGTEGKTNYSTVFR